MADERYLPVNWQLPSGDVVRNLYVKGRAWQLYATAEGGQVLAVRNELHDQWIENDLIEPGIFEETEHNCLVWYALADSMISSVEFGPYPTRKEQAESFVHTLKRTRERFGRVSLSDALYIAQFSMLLPTFSNGAKYDDAIMLGRWLTGGVTVSVTDAARIRRYAPWLSAGMLDRILSQMGLSADAGETGIIEGPPSKTEAAAANAPKRGERKQGEFCLPGRPAIERFFRDEILHVIDHEEEYRRMGVGFPGASLLYGPPGCGKTFAVTKLTEYLGWPVYTVTSGSVGSKYIHETSRKVSEIFDQAIANAPAVIVIDEMEAFLSSRESSRSSGDIHLEEVAEFLRRIPDAAKNRVLLFGMTNMPDAIDKAILRRGRFDHMIEIGMPSQEEVRTLLESLLKDLPTNGDLKLDRLAARLTGLPLSDVDFVVRQAGRLAVREGKEWIDARLLEHACSGIDGGKRREKKMGFQ